MNIIKVNNLTKIYKQGNQDIYALDDVSFSVKKGEFIAVVGASGSGKSTLIHTLGCVDKQTSGDIIIDGINTNKLDENALTIFRRRQIGLVYQFYNLIPTLNVENNIKLPVLLDGETVDETYYHDILKSFGLEDRVSHLPSELSGGQQQRVSIARAIMNRPSILLLDEPTENLDQKNSREVMGLIKASHQKYHQTILLITHDETIASMADRVIKIEDGRIVYDGVVQ